jgi:large subunit ribosomal protein L10
MFMALSKEKKEEILEKLMDIFKNAKSAVFVNFHGFPVSDSTNMRNGLRGQGIGYFVAKKTLIKRSLNDQNIRGEMPELQGEIAIAFSSNENDTTAPAREINEFMKKHKENIAIVGGIFDGQYMNMEEMMSIANIPPLQTLYGMFVNIINSPIQRCAIALNQIAQMKS